ncbi:hypothetical protein B0A49_02713 [Cryomyces minteri]|uniref:Uncharacterized protein n=1 Tax=Cryomyces minteri TaxID=331657 RepID=A0A4U0XMU0_9PEZI|nr:hypothetical protein B0A49_02713 [Cryomyces minteri]
MSELPATPSCQALLSYPNLPWEIRFIYGHHTYNSAAACNQTNSIVVAATPQNVSYNTCTLISSLYGNRYPAAAAIYLGGTSALSEIDVFYATSAQKRCAEGQSTFCNQLGAPGWYCIYNMYLINNMIIVS